MSMGSKIARQKDETADLRLQGAMYAFGRQPDPRLNCPASVFSPPDRGTVSLVALCFVAVLGISLAGYISLSSRAMQLSNRSFQANVSQQLAELGLEEALRAFNKNDWSDWSTSGYAVDWTLDTINKRATAVLTVPVGSFGQGTTATVRIRVDNYDATHLGSTWNSSTNYRINDLVGYGGTWYRSVQNGNSNHSPGDLTWWVPAPISWTWGSNISYAQHDLVNYNGTWYRCLTSHTGSSSNQPPNTSYWVSLPSIGLSWSSSTSYSRGAIVCDSGNWYYSINSSNLNHPPPDPTYWAPILDSSGAPASAGSNTYASGTAYYVGDYIFRNSSDTWYRCVASQPYTYSGSDYSDTTKWVSSEPYVSWAYQSGATYNFDDIVYYGSPNPTWYRCKVASTTSAPSSTSDWENALSGTNTTSTPGPHGWSSSSINYNLWDTVYYNDQWYRCIKAHTSSTSITPTSATYWSNTPLFSTAWDSGRQYSQNDTVRHNGVWYLSVQNGNVAQNPSTATTYWIGANTSNVSYTWNATTSYSAGVYRCYGGVWYKCLVTHSNKSPSDTTYWTPTWANSAGITTGAPVVYAEATVSIVNSPPLKTQLRTPLAPAPLFPNAAGASTDLTITTGTGTVDSYDHSLGTGYTAQIGTSTNYSAVLAAGTTLAINGTTAVKGHLAWPSPPSGISSGTTVKSATSAASPNLDTARLSRSPYIPQFDILPSGNLANAVIWNALYKGTAIPNPTSSDQTLNLGTAGAITPSRYFHDGDFRLEASQTANYKYVNINGPVVLQIKGSFRIQPSGRLQINSGGSARILYGSVFRIYAGGELRNTTQEPKNLVLLTDSSTTDLTFLRQNTASPKDFHGLIYSPNIGSSVGVEIENGINFYGAISAKKVTFSDQANLHYDTSLRHVTVGGVDQPYAATEWRELPASEQATMP